MQRLLLFVLLVGILPMGVYWASHGFPGPGATLARFASEVGALRGLDPEPPPEPPPAPPAEPEPPPEVVEPPPVVKPEDEALEHFRAGRFGEAARAYAGANEEQRALAELGAALAAAFPEAIPDLPYVVAQSAVGSPFEGFLEESGGNVRLTDPGGRSLSLPATSLHSRTVLPRAKAVERMAGQIRDEAAGTALAGARLFALLQRAFAIGRPELAAPLLARAMALDEEERFFLSGVRSRVPEAHQGALYRAYSACQLAKAPPIESVAARAPTRIGGGTARPGASKGTVTNARVRDLLVEAAPMREEGERLYRAVAIQELRDVRIADIDEAIRLLDKAASLYEKAVAIEDTNEVNALLRHSSKLLFSLRFWKQQAEGR